MNAKIIGALLVGLAAFGAGSVASAQDHSWNGNHGWSSDGHYYDTHRGTYWDRHTVTHQHWGPYIDRHRDGSYGVHVGPYTERHTYTEPHRYQYVERHHSPYEHGGCRPRR